MPSPAPPSRRLRARLWPVFTGQSWAALLPAAMLAGYWLGGEPALIAVAMLGLGLVAMGRAGASRRPGGAVDSVTGLMLRDEAEQRLDRLLSGPDGPGRTACFALSLEGLDDLSETFGPAAAEHAVNRVSARLAAALRGTDALARLPLVGLAVVVHPLTRADLETLLQIAGRLIRAAREPVALAGGTAHLGACIGFCLPGRAPAPGGGAMLEAAEAALRAARAAGPGSIRAYRPSMHRAGAARHETERTLAAALEAGEIRPWYQPQLSTDTGRLTGVEALTRWHHPERGVLCPDDFLPALVEAGLAERLAEEIRFQSFSALAAWDRAGIDVPRVAVNFTAEDLGAPDLADRIAWELDRFDLAPSRLTVEILESVIAAPGDEAVARSIAALADLGCAIDLDDFGTGHASLAALGRFAIGRIKIDRSFVAGIDTARPRQDMVAAILGLADRLGLDTLGEGVETLGENAALAQLGCGHVQGHAIAPPLPFAEMLAWTMKHREKLARSTLGAPRAPPPCGGKTA